ncbi:MAG: S46 family peptidase [Bacteroidota bacterium]|nr:S46 family peptidase [Candidatus Kapabacteria bacterium]MDW8220696.1 S46 family peptidase [Bacteroidota bacterium]
MLRNLCASIVVLVACARGLLLQAWARYPYDEGLWTFDSPPRKILFERYQFVPSKEWLDTLRLSTVRFTSGGGSGAFVSSKGLVITNHHVILEHIEQLSTKDRDILNNGFVATTQVQELQCIGLELDVLLYMENITARVLSVAKKGMTDAEIFAARQAEIRRIEAEASSSRAKVRGEVVTLYAGGEYWLYRYRRYTDIRLVAVPELQAANFGGDYDNFTYPRYALDFALLRVYDNGKPISSPYYLKWKTKGCSAHEPVFVAGYPSATNRFSTYAQFVFNRDVFYPFMLRRINALLMAARRYGERGVNEYKRALPDILNDENAKKALAGEYRGLTDRSIEEKLRRTDEELRQKVYANPELRALYGDAWEAIERIMQKQTVIFKDYTATFSTPLADMAFSIIRYALEKEYTEFPRKRTRRKTIHKHPEASIDSTIQVLDKAGDKQASSAILPSKVFKTELLQELRTQALADIDIDLDYEEIRLAGELEFLLSELSAGDPLIRSMLGGEGGVLRAPAEVAREVVRGTRLIDVNVRKALLDGGRRAIELSTDPMIVFMRKLVPLWLEREEYYRTHIQIPLTFALEKIALARFAIYGKSIYPDADFSLRLSIGTVKGYTMNGTLAPAQTTLYGLFDRAASFSGEHTPSHIAQEFRLPARFAAHRESALDNNKISLATPVNFVTTCDIVSGNSGSPLVNKHLEFVGLVFDGNVESLAGRFAYNEETGRTICVHPAFIIESLRKIYHGGAIADELEHKTSTSRGN